MKDKNLDHLTKAKLEKELLNQQVLFHGKHSKLEVLNTPNNNHLSLNFYIPENSTTIDAREEINSQLQSLQNYPSYGWKIEFSRCLEQSEKYSDSALVNTIINFSIDLKETVKSSKNPRSSYEKVLLAKGMDFVSDTVLRLAIGQFRIAAGFPSNPEDIGTINDPGDLTQGNAFASDIGSIKTTAEGVEVMGWRDFNAPLTLVGQRKI